MVSNCCIYSSVKLSKNGRGISAMQIINIDIGILQKKCTSIAILSYTASGRNVNDVPLSTSALKLVCLRQELPIQHASTPTIYISLK